MTNPPTDAQMRFLASLKYNGEPPVTKAEASFLIDGRKSGQDSAKLQREMLRLRQKAQGEWFKQQRGYCRMELQQAREPGEAIAGFRVRVGKRCDAAKQYHGAFVPTQVALKHPELLPPYKGICQHWTCECEFESVLESDRLSLDTPMIIKPGRITTVRKARRKRRPALMLLVLAGLVYLGYRLWNTSSGT